MLINNRVCCSLSTSRWLWGDSVIWTHPQTCQPTRHTSQNPPLPAESTATASRRYNFTPSHFGWVSSQMFSKVQSPFATNVFECYGWYVGISQNVTTSVQWCCIFKALYGLCLVTAAYIIYFKLTWLEKNQKVQKEGKWLMNVCYIFKLNC